MGWWNLLVRFIPALLLESFERERIVMAICFLQHFQQTLIQGR